ncbi:MAG: glucokinase [Chthoniobacterales bacterium]
MTDSSEKSTSGAHGTLTGVVRSKNPLYVLAGDVGGTKTNLAIFQVSSGELGHELILVRNQRYPSQSYTSLNGILREFLAEKKEPILSACFGIPGAVKNGKVKPTNLTWSVDATELGAEFNFRHSYIINDLLANAYGISELKPNDFETLNVGELSAKGNLAVISPGTGLGEAGIYSDGKKFHPFATEGGHTDFGPRNSLEVAMLEYLIKQFGHVSPERIASGQGLENIYKFLRDTERGVEDPEVAREMTTTDPGAVITKNALASTCPMCQQALEIFISCLGAEAGNLALKVMATGGVYIGGGIPVRILSKLRGTSFLDAFFDKGRLSSLMRGMPVHVILNDDAALLGSARYALNGAEPLLSSPT